MVNAHRISVSVRLRRTVVQHAVVSVPMNEALMETGVDVNRLMSRAVEMGDWSRTKWQPERDAVVELHPVQTPTREA